jgi:predicted nucleic acid-binding protein
LNLVDSSGWLEYFTDGKNADKFAAVIENTERLMVSAINIYEVYKKVIGQRDEDAALEAVAAMQQAKVIEVTSSIAMQAAKFSHIFKIPLADSIIYITARDNNAVVWTQDADFKDMEGVKYFEKN